MDKSSEALYSLKPVNFRYRPNINPGDNAEHFGLIAEEVEKINPDLVSYDSEGKPITVRYESVNAMLLNEFLKEHRKVENLQATIHHQQKELENVIARLKQQESQIQKVRAQVELNRATPQTVANK